MTRAEEYRYLATKIRVRASHEESPIMKAEWENLAKSIFGLQNSPRRAITSTFFTTRSLVFWAGSRH